MTEASRLRLVVEYDGGAFFGWQEQRGPKGQRTVQGALMEAIHALTGESPKVYGASRTDAGVHARGQVAAFDIVRRDIPVIGFQRGLTTLLPDDVVVRRVDLVASSFDPRRHARGKHYRYHFWDDPTPSALERGRYWHARGRLDLPAMRRAAASLCGTHDFEAFRAVGCSAAHAVRRIYRLDLTRGEGPRLHLDVVGNAFVRNMVRILAGTLYEVGMGRRTPEDVASALVSRDRKQAGMTAPAHGLCLEEVFYDDRLPPRPKDREDVRGRRD